MTVIYFLMVKKSLKPKAKKSGIKANQLTLGSISTSANLSNYMEMFTTLVLTIVLFQMIKYKIFTII